MFFQVEFKQVNETVLELSVWRPFNSGLLVISHASGEDASRFFHHETVTSVQISICLLLVY